MLLDIREVPSRYPEIGGACKNTGTIQVVRSVALPVLTVSSKSVEGYRTTAKYLFSLTCHSCTGFRWGNNACIRNEH